MRLFYSFLIAASRAEFNPECPSQKPADECAVDCTESLVSCNQSCGADPICISDCNREYAQCGDVCPCNTQCFDGCPCEYASTYCGPRSGPIFLHIQSPDQDRSMSWYRNQYDEEVSFTTSITPFTSKPYSCSFRIGFRMYIVGAHESPFSQHVYQLASYGYDRKADLPFAFDEGRCIGYDDKALLCAADDRTNIDNDKKCYYYYSDGTTAEAPSTNEKHHLGEMATNGDKVMIIAGKRTRTFEHFNGEEWTMGAGEVPGPFFKFSSVTFNNVPFIFGGESTPRDVATYQNNAWSMHEKKLQVPRYAHDSVVWENYIVLVGGVDNLNHEIWEWRNGTMDDGNNFDVYQSKVPIHDYSYYPSVFALDPASHSQQ